MSHPVSSPVIRLRGVRHNNLKNFDLDLPLRRLIVVTGLSGSGKSSLAFDTLYAEGQRRYIETFSPYARQFFDRMDKPQVDSIEGIPPAIAIEQRNSVRTTRSTVGTMTEICDYLKVLWPHISQLHCRQCGKPVRKDSPQSIWQTLTAEITASVDASDNQTKTGKRPPAPPLPGERAGVRETATSKSGESKEYLITFDVPLAEKLSLTESLALIAKQGYQRVLVKDEIKRIGECSHLSPLPSHLTVVQDRIKPSASNRSRFTEACEQAYHFGKGKLAIRELPSDSRLKTLDVRLFSNRLHCATCNLEYPDPTPALFSFNHPLGACPACKGFGRVINIDYNLALPDRSLTLADGAVKPWRTGTGAESLADLLKYCKIRKVPTNVPFAQLPAHQQKWVIEGDPDYGIDDAHTWPRAWYGIKGYFKWLETKSYKMHVRVLLSRYRAYTPCPTCDGARFQPDTLLYLLSIDNRRLTISDFCTLPIRDALDLTGKLTAKFTDQSATAHRHSAISIVFSEIQARLRYLTDVGLGYLTLDRPTRTLSGGETERVNLTTCLGTRLVNTLFVLDEPSVGLHPKDTDRLVQILQQLRNAGNTVVVVEHEASVMRAADQIVDIGPGHGTTGGQVVFQGPYKEILKSKTSLTGQYLSGEKQIEIPTRRPVAADVRRLHPKSAVSSRQSTIKKITIAHASTHNLKDITAKIPLGRLVCITGVSGSGKSTLIRDVLYPALVTQLQNQAADITPSEDAESPNADSEPSSTLHSPSSTLTGSEHLGRVILVDQSSLGKTPRSNPAVYIGAFEDIRELFAQSAEAKQRGYNASAFSFNSGQGQCERCRGAGFEKIEMQFLSDVYIRCPDCDGRRYRPHILEVKISSRRGEEAKSSDTLSNGITSTSNQRASVSLAPPGGEGRGEGASYNYQSTTSTSELHDLPSTTKLATALTGGIKVDYRTKKSSIPAWSIADILDATVDEALEFLAGFPDSKPARRAVASIQLLQDAGLGYLRLGQPINTLSGGESQRLKLVAHLAESATTEQLKTQDSGLKTLFLFDEPTTGLHFDDVRVLLKVFQRMVDAGHSVIIIEHNLDVIKCADWVIDLGPDAGDQGGQIVAQGTPEEIAKCAASHTGQFLRAMLPSKSETTGKPNRPGRR